MRILPPFFLLVVTLGVSGCGTRSTPAAQASAGGQAMPVKVKTVQVEPVPNATEYLATVRSLNSAVIQPQVEGHLTKIYVTAGAHVKAGQALFQIDALKQEAAVVTEEATQQARVAQLRLAQTNLARAQRLATEGVISRQDLEQAQSAYDAAKATVEASRASVVQQKQQLRYYTVSAPKAGVIGDVPVRLGDRVETSTQLTTLDSGGGMELYVSISADKASAVKAGTKIEILPETGDPQPLVTQINFISPRLNEQDQLLLVKAPLPEATTRFRNEQLVHARVIWSTTPGIVLPFAVVSRLAGQIFVFVAEKQGDGYIAKQRRLLTDEVSSVGYVAREGLKPGEEVIVSKVQMLTDGMPITPQPAAAPPAPPAGAVK